LKITHSAIIIAYHCIQLLPLKDNKCGEHGKGKAEKKYCSSKLDLFALAKRKKIDRNVPKDLHKITKQKTQ